MVGSLYWDTSDIRTKWRKKRLKNIEFDVFVPIRYGRKSASRGNTYTMVFSQLCRRKDYGLGTAKVVACNNEATNIENIIEEAEHLWAVERNSSTTNGRFWANWGSVGLFCNPSTIFPANFFKRIGEITTESQQYGKLKRTKSEKPVLTKEGFFNLPWPKTYKKNQHLPFDIILATATNPTIENGRYPTAKAIAEAWKKDKKGNDKYFWENRKRGIHTFQDEYIANLLKNK